jgi:hypothetical protein
MNAIEARALLAEDLHEVLGEVASGLPVARLAAELERASRVFQALACFHLLETRDVEAFRSNLVRSVHARLFFLRRCRAEGNTTDRRLALSRTESLFDALASGHESSLRAMIAGSNMDFVPGWEYEDDHLYLRWIHELVEGRPDDIVQATAKQRRKALGRPADRRQAALEALNAGSQDDLTDALHGLSGELAEHAAQRQEGLQEFDLEACIQWPRSFVSVELLALLALGSRRGIQVVDPIPLCPQDARLPPGGSDVEDFFAGIERILAANRARGG